LKVKGNEEFRKFVILAIEEEEPLNYGNWWYWRNRRFRKKNNLKLGKQCISEIN
jgi:hypothetical protein